MAIGELSLEESKISPSMVCFSTTIDDANVNGALCRLFGEELSATTSRIQVDHRSRSPSEAEQNSMDHRSKSHHCCERDRSRDWQCRRADRIDCVASAEGNRKSCPQCVYIDCVKRKLLMSIENSEHVLHWLGHLSFYLCWALLSANQPLNLRPILQLFVIFHVGQYVHEMIGIAVDMLEHIFMQQSGERWDDCWSRLASSKKKKTTFGKNIRRENVDDLDKQSLKLT